jgi:cell filamentation protein
MGPPIQEISDRTNAIAMSKYDAAGSQSEYQSGSDNQVLKNKLGITVSDDMDDVELVLLKQLYDDVLIEHFPTGGITVAQIKNWHRRWFGNIYDWAGQERSVNMGKDGFQFAAAAQVPRLLQEFERKYLALYTPCTDLDDAALIEAIATVHVEFILIHPFREGNGRLARLLADVMAVQAGYDPLDYSSWDENKQQYIAAIHAGLGGNYVPMMGWVEKAFNAE